MEDFRTRADNGAVVHNAFRKTLGRVDEDVMGRSGQLVRPRSLDAGGVAGGVAGGEELVARLVVRLVFSLFF